MIPWTTAGSEYVQRSGNISKINLDSNATDVLIPEAIMVSKLLTFFPIVVISVCCCLWWRFTLNYNFWPVLSRSQKKYNVSSWWLSPDETWILLACNKVGVSTENSTESEENYQCFDTITSTWSKSVTQLHVLWSYQVIRVFPSNLSRNECNYVPSWTEKSRAFTASFQVAVNILHHK